MAYATSGGGAALGGNVVDWVRQAMQITGVPESWFGPLMSRVKLESGGNPRAINLWDSNAKKGIPSKGLFQTIDPTFNRYALPGMHDIWNPVHNGVAAIRYMQARYGSIFNINPRTGYAEGGVVHETPWDSGGTAKPGWNLINNTTGGDEVLRPWTGGDGMPQVHVTANIVVYVGDTELRSVIRQEISVEQDKRDRRVRSGASA
jgi:SLT domain-containing protein